ncbi:serine/threonine-protein kinase [Alteromonadaceae bacterium 2753L.S.0a.02]|nr:serine/threonine-protein kinase [Alteromonadaceae bacterium 2753L.S.0a.02]
MIAGILVAIVPWQPGWLNGIDRSLFVLSSYLVEAPKGASNMGLVEVEDAEITQWQSNLYDAGKLAALLSNILHSSGATVGLLLDAPLRDHTEQVDSLLAKLAAQKPSRAQRQAAEFIERKELLVELLNDPRVVIGVLDSTPEPAHPVTQESNLLSVFPAPVRSWLWPLTNASEHRFTKNDIPQHTAILPHSSEQALLLGDPLSGDAAAGFIAQFIASVEGRGKVRSDNPWNMVWRQDRGLDIDTRLIPLSAAGTLLPYNATTQRMHPLLNTMSLEEGLARGAFPDFVLIGRAGNPALEQLAATLFSVVNQHLAITPWWQAFTSPLLTILITLVLVAVIPRLTVMSGALSLLLIAVALLVSQLVFAVARGIWLPRAEQLVWMLVGFGLIRLWVSYRHSWQQLQTRADSACLFQVAGLLDSGQLKDVKPILDQCDSSNDVLQKYYDLGNAYSAKRQYRYAIEVYQALVVRQPDFRDTEQKIKALEAMVATPEVPVLKPSNVEATLVLSKANIERPVLGRYEIREELGRGAMGIVYLGFDPRIARQVAIKTLNYGQFQPRELENIKSRFFREAEAAGRLTHPSIVSVYDVGEESDLAFIAMDYVEGKALNAFIDPNCLLPVFEVYRIIADVAVALEYAHNSNIVHRDIKPGNIIYNPSPYQVKVTDFGIARLMDDSKTNTGEILGSPLYMSPEQLKGKRVNATADVFSLGVTFYQLLCGQLPFSGDNLASLTYEIIHGKHKGVRTVRKDLPSSASRITNQCLQKEAQDRYESAGELALVLKKAIKRDFAHEARKAGYL